MYCDLLQEGSGIPIVFIHGFLGTSKDWRQVVDHLPNHHCIAYDLPGHGKTPWSETPIEELLTHALPQTPIHLIGYSLGGRLAARFAIKYPSRIQTLTLISTNYGLRSEKEKHKRLHSDQIWAQKILTKPRNEFLLEWYSQPIFSSLQCKPQLKDQIIDSRTNQRPEDLAKALMKWSLGHQKCLQSVLFNCLHSVQIIIGECDDSYCQLYAGWPSIQQPSSKVHTIAGSGHLLPLEAPKEIAGIISRKN